MTTLTVRIPPRIQQNIQILIAEGWFENADTLVQEALRRYLESHSVELMTQFIRDDIQWGLYGDD